MPAPLPGSGVEPALAARATMDAVADSGNVFESFFISARIGLALADLSGRFLRVNDSYADLVGRAAEDLVGVPLTDVLSGADREALDLSPLLEGGEASVQSERGYIRPDGAVVWVLNAIATVPAADGSPGWFAVSAQDITERRQAEQHLRELHTVLSDQAVRDPLTGLANRALLGERLKGALARDARSGEATGVLFLDLDGFKEVNDRYGHEVGDTVLRQVADRLQRACRPSDTVARLGGDEFVVVVEGATPAALEVLSNRLTRVVTAPLRAAGKTLNVGVSVGVALTECGRAEAAALLSQADARMYDAKRRAH